MSKRVPKRLICRRKFARDTFELGVAADSGYHLSVVAPQRTVCLLLQAGLLSCGSSGADVLTARPSPALLAAHESQGATGMPALQSWQSQMIGGRGQPFDGAVVDLGFRYQAASGVPVVAADHAAEVSLVRAVAAAGKRQNFQILNLSPLPADWQDDATFAIIERNFETAAALAAQAQMPGLVIENQMYGASAFAFPANAPVSFAQQEDVVRERGAALGAALVRGFPQVQLLFSWAYAEMFRALCFEGGTLQAHPYALYPAFLEGMQRVIERAGTGAKIIDGFLPAYPTRRPQDFQLFRALVHADYAGVAQKWQPQVVSHLDDLGRQRGPVTWPDEFAVKCDPQTATRLAVRLPAAFGLMVDYNVDAFARELPQDVPRYGAEALAPAIMAAVRASDTYVWLYTGFGSWWDRGAAPSSVDPAVFTAVSRAKQQLVEDPLGAAP